jgi:hypothetical protein
LTRNDSDEFKIIPMEPGEAHGSSRTYTCAFNIDGHGLLNMNARLRPADPVLQGLHPELIRWVQ